MFTNLPALSKIQRTAPSEEIERYLSEPREDVDDALMWWYERRAVYPCLSRMARDFLAIPGTSFFTSLLIDANLHVS